MDKGCEGAIKEPEENLADMVVESTENNSVDHKEDNAGVHKDMAGVGDEEEGSTHRSDYKSEPNLGNVGNPCWGQEDANTNGENLETMNSDRLRSKVLELSDTVEELEESLHQRSTEVNAKNEVLKRNAGIMRNMHMRNQQKDQKIQEMTSRMADLEKKVEAMEEFEKSLVKTMVNPDMKEIVETVKEQRERILQLEKKVREKEEEVEHAEALLDEMNEEKEERVTPAMLRLRGINVTLARGDEVRETTNTALETDSGKMRVGDGLQERRMENGGGKPPAPLADILRANMGLTVQRPAGGESEGGNENEEKGENIAVNRGPAAEGEELHQTKNPTNVADLLQARGVNNPTNPRGETNPTDVADLLRARGVSIQRSTSSDQHSSMHGREENHQDDGNFSNEEDEDREEEGFSNVRNAEKRPYNYIEEEKERRREKRMREFEEEVKTDAFWSSTSAGERDGIQDEEWDDEDDEDGSGVRVWENGGLIVKEWEEEGRRVLQWEVDGWVEECPDCLRGWVHLCPNDANFPNFRHFDLE